ncbi:DUF171-domain-containing protein [Bimuria novae-zelandiae CBS 107.79]|uniref:DUF171-domain-containing protein n=1 Tax=Bimuria novae-zelandiae CBS 107.79 TaxID=1447943 RepID=A0A6A5UME5_9PLEO|nr:DUF171-domain-containing protein [Bimuria novae-zelandiae CBS 107.79]
MARINLDAPIGTMGTANSRTKMKAAKEPVEYINGKGWVDEDGNVVEAETGKARNRRALELVDNTLEEHEAREQEERRAAKDTDDAVRGDGTLGAAEMEKKGKKRKLGAVHHEDTPHRQPRPEIWEVLDSEDEQAGKRTKRAAPDGKQHHADAQIQTEQQKRSENKESRPSPTTHLSTKDSNPAQPATRKEPPPMAPSKGKMTQELRTEKPSAVFKPRKSRSWTVTIALPGSILNNVARHDTKTLLVGRIARAAAVWCIDEIVVFDDDPHTIPDKVSPHYRNRKKSKVETMDSISEADIPYQHPDLFMKGLLEYADCPPHLRSALFPMCEPLKYVGLLPPLDTPSHTKPDEWLRFREGVAIAPPVQTRGKNRKQEWTYINCGLPYPVRVPYDIPQGVRLTVEFKDDRPPPAWPHLSDVQCANLAVDAVAPEAPREQEGYYWGYKVRRENSFNEVFTGTEFPGGYSFVIGTSERGVPLTDILPDTIAPRNCPPSSADKLPDAYKHLLVVFGGVAGLEPVVANDVVLGTMSKEEAHQAFDYWVNLVQNQGSRTIRTEEAIEIGLAGLKGYMDFQYEHSPTMRKQLDRQSIGSFGPR